MDSRRESVTAMLRDRIHAGLHIGVLRPGDRVDSIRDVTARLHVHPRTVQDAYRRLAAEGLVEVRSRSGVFVGSVPAPHADLPEMASALVEFFLRQLSRDPPPSDVLRQMRQCLQMAPVRAACLECNDDQIHAMRSQLEQDYGFEAVGLDVASLRGARSLPPLDGVDLILTTRFHGGEAERLGRRLRRPVVQAVLDTSFFTEVGRLLAAGPLWWICTDPRFVVKLGRMWPGRPIVPVVLGREDLDAIPPDAQVYATRRAMDRLPRAWHGGRVATVRRAFSPETARALVAFRLRRTLARRAP